MLFFLLFLYDYTKHQLATAPWKGLIALVPGWAVYFMDSLTSGFRLAGAVLSCIVAALTIYSWVEARIKKRKAND